MLDWLVVAALLSLVIAVVAPHQLGVTAYKLSLVSLAAVAGYWIDRSLFYYARPDDFSLTDAQVAAAYIRRAIIVGACIVGVSLGA
jgi:hypothetical protein